jgi:feruloyl-CoA hydratase/lyase
MQATTNPPQAPRPPEPWGKDVKVEFERGIAWVTLNRPEKRNAMSPALNREMIEVLDALELDDRCKVLVLTGAGESYSSGMDIKEYFRETDNATAIEVSRVRRDSMGWQWRRLMYYPKPTIAMVNGWCFGGAFTSLCSCDLAIAADEATFGLSEINWGIIPAGNAMRAAAEKMSQSDALYYLMTGETFNGQQASEMKLVNESVPRSELRARTEELARKLMTKNLHVMRAIKNSYHRIKYMSWDMAEEYVYAKAGDTYASDPDRGREKGMKQFLDDKTYRPGLENYRSDAA